MTSIRVFLIVTLIATITLVNFVSALHGYRKSLEEADRLFNGLLKQKADLITAYVLDRPLPVNAEETLPKVIKGFFNKEDPTFSFQVWDTQNRLVVRSSNAPEEPLLSLGDPMSEINLNGHRWIALGSFDNTKATWVIVAERSDIRYQLAEKIILESVFPIILVIPFIGGMVWLIVSFGLRPIAQLAGKLRKKEVRDLSPITMDHIPTELTLLATSANDLLGRLDASFAREKRFTGDAAHELRTPIAALKIHLQNLLSGLDTSPASAEKMKHGIDRMGHLVEQILQLNRTASDHFMAQWTCLDLAEIAKKVIRDQILSINRKNQTISFLGGSCVIDGDPFSIEVLIKNLVSNAVKYTPPGGTITIHTEATDRQQVTLKVIDNGSGIPKAQYERVFDRFYRLPSGRHDVSEMGCGLGLSIVKQIVDLHNASIVMSQTAHHQGLCVSVHFPAVKQGAGNIDAPQIGK
ncbi:MAG: ATP-binding protein [Nitrospiria bacterium]